MKYADLPVGKYFYFGREMMTHGASRKQWRKISEDGKAVATDYIRIPMDAPRRASGENRAVKAHGYHFFPKSYLYQWLNDLNGVIGWNPGDGRPIVFTGSSFLDNFSEYELELLVPMEEKYQVPAGYIKRWGRTFEIQSFVTIPSYEELAGKTINGMEIPDKLNEILKNTIPYDALTSTTNTMCISARRCRDGSVTWESVSPLVGRRVYPIIKISGEADLQENAVADEYQIEIKRPSLSKDILSIME